MGRTGALPGEVRFDPAGPVFYTFWDVGGRMADEICFQDTQNPKPLNLNLT